MKLLYFLYLCKTTDYQELNELIAFISEKKGQSKNKTIKNILRDFWKFNTAFSDYFFLEFYDKSDDEKKAYASTWYMYKFQSKLNDKNFTKFFKNKKLFYRKFEKFIKHSYFIPEENTEENFKNWLNSNKPAVLMVKQSNGQAGTGLEKVIVTQNDNGEYSIGNKDLHNFYTYAAEKKYDLFDTFIDQHPTLNSISPNALSTLRVISIIDKNKNVHILKPLIRMSNESFVDNFHKGGISTAIDANTGKLIPPMFFRDPRKPKSQTKHPATGKKVIGLEIPFWSEIVPMIKMAALKVPEVRTVGWDVVITSNGPGLLEGNDNWDKTHYEKIHQEGLKPFLDSLNI